MVYVENVPGMLDAALRYGGFVLYAVAATPLILTAWLGRQR